MPAPLPTIQSRQDNGDSLSCKLAIDASLPQFKGHFPGSPVLPGIAQVDWAVQLVKAWDHPATDIEHLSRVKFIRPVLPGDELQLTIERRDEGVYRYRFSAGQQDYSSGVLHFHRRG